MREIKFRGRHTTTNKVIYGYAFKYPGQTSWYILDAHAEQWRMKKDSLAQLIAVDTNGEEVYEGDKIKHKRGAYFAVGVDEISKTTAATFKHYAGILSGEIVKVA